MFKDKTIRAILFGKENELSMPTRACIFKFPATEDDDKDREVRFPGNDGFFLYLIKRIEKLEEQIKNKKTK